MERVLGTVRRVRTGGRDRLSRFARSDRGMTTSEYAVGTIAACGFAAVLYKVVTSGPVLSAMQALIKDALDAKF
ncbi:DUF4244 domain-containing protein [Streptomyces sp. NBC_00234]|uniref:DUF4244 domain-containing protein n=1 Tax=Streptomyces sp. NBC_00234 TaxID=2903638 RepID=UPI002E2B1EB0|nr:DUF4244 domain-containing protein [Streptomyces sp. NBC_00234]